MKKFDLIYEKYISLIKEKTYIDSTFKDNIRSLVKMLKDNDYISVDTEVERLVDHIWKQDKHVKTLNLDTNENALPPIRLHMTQPTGSERFSVSVINLNDPEHPREFENDFLETIFKDVIDSIKEMSLSELDSSNAVTELPPTEGPAAQPGSGESELPSGSEQEYPEEQKPNNNR